VQRVCSRFACRLYDRGALGPKVRLPLGAVVTSADWHGTETRGTSGGPTRSSTARVKALDEEHSKAQMGLAK